MAELVDALGSGPSRGNPVDVRVILVAFVNIESPLMTSVALIANGRMLNYSKFKPVILDHDQIIAVDGGLHHCHKMGITPHLIVGDLDSIDAGLKEEYSEVRIQPHPTEKDQSDLDLAVMECIRYTPARISLFGALGRRVDHSLSNLLLLSKFPGLITIESEFERVFSITGNNEVQCKPGQVVSFFSLCSPQRVVKTRGLKWELNDFTIDESNFSLSNKCLGDNFFIDVGSSTIFCCLVSSYD